MSDEAVKASAEFNDSLDTLKRTFSGVKNNLVGELLPGFSTLLNGLSALLAGNDKAKEQIQKGTQEIVDSLKDIFPRVMDILMTLIGAVAEIAPVIIDSLVQGISANMGELVSVASDIVVTFLESLIAALPQIAEGAVKLITQLTDAILDNLPLLVSTTMQVITTVIDGIADALPALIPTVVSALLDAVQAIIDNIGAFVDAGVKVILALVDGVVKAIPVLIQKIPVIVKSVIDALKNALPTLIDGVKQLISALAKALPDIITAIVEMLPDLLTTIVEGVKELLPVLIEGIIDVVNTIIETKLGSYYTKAETDAKLTDRMKVKTQALTNLNQCDSLTDPDTLYQIKYAGVEEILLNTSNSSGQLRLNKNGYIYFRNYNASAGTWSEWTNAMKNIPPETITTAMIGRLWLSYDNLDDHYIRYFDYTELSSMDELTDYAIYTGVTDDSWRSQYDVDGHFLLLVTENTQLLMFPVSNRVFTRERPNNGDWGTWTDISPVSESSISTIAGEVADNKLTKYYTKTEMNSKLYEKENIVVNTSAQLSDCDNCYATETLYRLIINGQEHLLINAGTRAAQYRFTNGDVFYRVYQNRAWTEWENILTRIPDDAITGDMIQDSAISADKLEDIYPALHYADEIGGEGDINDWSNGIYIGTLTENWRAHYGVSGHYILIADGMQIMYIPEANRVQFREKGHMGRWDSWEVIDLCSYAVVHREVHGEAGYISENYAWYTEPSQGLSLTGTYTLVGDFCTINGTVPLIEGWETVYYSLPCNSLFSASAIARCGDDVFTIATNTLDNISVIEIKKLGGGTLPSGTLSFTLTYRYLEPKIGA